MNFLDFVSPVRDNEKQVEVFVVLTISPDPADFNNDEIIDQKLFRTEGEASDYFLSDSQDLLDGSDYMETYTKYVSPEILELIEERQGQ
jgi:hypothetical protein